MHVAVLESVFHKYWLPWCLMVIECFVQHIVMSPEYCTYLHFHIPGSMCVGVPWQCGYGGVVSVCSLKHY